VLILSANIVWPSMASQSCECRNLFTQSVFCTGYVVRNARMIAVTYDVVMYDNTGF
jgi:hypothetical protein